MTSVKQIEDAVAKLEPEELAQFRVWFEEFETARFDQKIERDGKNGKLDGLGVAALEDHRRGNTRQL